jgi:hypothetical protein
MSILFVAVIGLVLVVGLVAGAVFLLVPMLRNRGPAATLTCPHCGQETPSDRPKCGACGRDLVG